MNNETHNKFAQTMAEKLHHLMQMYENPSIELKGFSFHSWSASGEIIEFIITGHISGDKLSLKLTDKQTKRLTAEVINE